jgi:dihydrolipoamide dehydrogenase
VKRSRGVSGRLNGGVGMLLKKNKVDVIWGEAKIDAPGKVHRQPADEIRRGPAEGAAEGRARAWLL